MTWQHSCSLCNLRELILSSARFLPIHHTFMMWWLQTFSSSPPQNGHEKCMFWRYIGHLRTCDNGPVIDSKRGLRCQFPNLNVVKSVLCWKVQLGISFALFVLWYHSTNLSNTPCIYKWKYLILSFSNYWNIINIFSLVINISLIGQSWEAKGVKSLTITWNNYNQGNILQNILK